MSEKNKILLLTDWLREKINECRDRLCIAEATNCSKDYAFWKEELDNYKQLLRIAMSCQECQA